MALINNPNSWNGGTAVFNAAPIVETYLKLAAHREAKNAAFDQYHQKQMEGIDRDGVRDVDVPDFEKKASQWNQHWQMNKEKLRKGDMTAQLENDKLYRDLRGMVKQSKDRDLAKKDALTVGTTLKKENGTLPDSFLSDLENNDRPLSDPEVDPNDKQPKSRRFNPVGYLNETAPWDAAKGLKKYDQLPKNEMTTYGATDPKTGMRMSTKTEAFDDKAKASIAAIAGSDYQNDPSFTKAVKSAVADPQTKQHLEQVYRDQMGKDPEHPEEYATALILSQKALSKTESKPELDKDWEARRAQKDRVELENIKLKGRKVIEGIKQGNREGLLKARAALKGASKKEEDNALDVIFGDLETESNKPGHKWETTKDGKKTGDYQVAPISPTIKKLFAQEVVGEDGKKSKIEPTHVGFNKDGTVKVIYTNGGVGDRLSVDKKLSHDISKNEFKAMIGKGLGLGVKITGAAKYSEPDENDDDDDNNDEVIPSVQAPTKKPKDPLKLF